VKAAPPRDELYLAHTEIRHLQLRKTIEALRDELQTSITAKEAAVQSVVAAGHDEARQLQATIAALRDELENKTFQLAEESARHRQSVNDEVRQLRDTVSTLRAELERKHGR